MSKINLTEAERDVLFEILRHIDGNASWLIENNQKAFDSLLEKVEKNYSKSK